MKIFGREIKLINFGSKKNDFEDQDKRKSSNVMASSYWGNTYTVVYDGEKNKGEIGPILDYRIDFNSLSNRSWQSYLESDISQTILNRFTTWVIGNGLKLQISPDKKVLDSEGINIKDTENFNEITEARFRAWAKSKKSSYSDMMSLNEIATEAFKNAKVGGDVLVIIRYVKKTVKIQLVDGRHVKSTFNPNLSPNGKRVVNGIEIDSKGKHIRYHVETSDKTVYVDAWDKETGLRKAFLVYGNRYRIDDHRGLPKIAASLETISKMDRYKEAAVGSAEERAKITYSIEHNQHSDGENPTGPFAKMFSQDDDGTVPVTEDGTELANRVTATTNKSTFNLPIGASLKSLESKMEGDFSGFWDTNANIICSAMNIPPNVAFSVYTDSFSASRAATKDWDNTLILERDNFDNQFYSHIFSFWFHFEVLLGKIQAPGYLTAFTDDNWIVLEGYLNHKFTGKMFPHIDPLKEVKAEREKLGSASNSVPLTTIEAATEAVGTGEVSSNLDQYSKELETAKNLKIINEFDDDKSDSDLTEEE